MKRFVLAALISGIWINLSEFLRNEFLFKQWWLEKYESLRLTFPSGPVNGALWVLWGFLFAASVVALRRRLSFLETTLLAWVMGFVLMWIVIGNMNVLPHKILLVAVPWSVAEVAIAVCITQRFLGKSNA
jgi:membrane associated rhomboid family serine protease